MNMKVMNPENLMLQQAEGQWQKLLLLVLFKLQGRQPVVLTHTEIQTCMDEFAPGKPTLLTHGLSDRIVFQVITEEQGKEIAAHEASRFGTA